MNNIFHRHLTSHIVDLLDYLTRNFLKLGASNDPMTGELNLLPGTATDAPVKFAAGTLLTTPEAGAMEFDGTGIYLTPTNHRRFISLASDSIIATVTATTVASTTLWTGITNANELKAYRVYRIEGCGLINNKASSNEVTITINFGATAVLSLTTPVESLTNRSWHFIGFVTVRTTGATGTVSTFGQMDISTENVRTTTESIVVDTTVANNITLKATWDVADADNWLKLTQCWMATAD